MKKESVWRVLPLSKLYDQQAYQRPLSMAWVNKKFKEFDEGIVGSLIVNQRNDGTLSLIDGKQRKALLLKKGYREWMCQMFFGLTYEEEAEKFHLFNGKNSRRAISSYQDFISMVESRNPVALEILGIANKYGFRMGQGGCSDNKIKAISTVTGIYLRNNNTLDRLLKLIRFTWNGNKNSFATNLLLGMEMLINKAGDYLEDGEFINSLKRVDPLVVIRESYSKGNYAKYYAQTILDYYNNKKRSKRIPEDILMK